MDLLKKRWLILAASCIVNLCIGATYAWSVFASPMAEYLSELVGSGLTAGSIAMAFTLTGAIGPVTMISGGWINDKIGPKWLVFIGGILFGAGFILSGFSTGPLMLIIVFGILCGLGMGLVYGCTISNSVKFFPDKRGLVGGIATASYGISSVIVPPVANFIIEKQGITYTFKIMGIFFLVVICALAFLIEKCPDGYMPPGMKLSTKKTGSTAVVEKNWRKMLADPAFYLMLALLCCGAFSGLMIISQASSIGQNMIGFSAAKAAAAVSALALFNALGRVLSGFVSDKLGRVNTLEIICLISLGGLLMLYFAGPGNSLLFLAAVSVVGFSFGSFMGIYPGFTADRFGTKNNSVNYGIMFIGFSLAGIFAPPAAAKAFRETGSYKQAFITAMVVAAAGLILSLLMKIIENKKNKSQALS